MSSILNNNSVHYDFVGSFLRPQKLKEARVNYASGIISHDELTAIENEAIVDVVNKQKALGYRIISDGEFRRTYWHLDFMWGLDGIGHQQTGGGVQFHGELAQLEDTYLTGKIGYSHTHPFIGHFMFVKSFEDGATRAKLTVPAPAQLFQQLNIPQNYQRTREIYKTNDELIADIALAYRAFIREFYEVGGRILQFDDCTWGAIVGDAAAQRYKSLGLNLDEVKEQLLRVNNLAIEGKPADLQINSHICRGNYHSTYFTSGPYDGIAEYLFSRENVDTLYLEYDDERSGGFEPLAKLSADKRVVLGLITSKSPQLEDKDFIKARILEAAKYVNLDRLSLSPQCGFASCEIGNKLTEEEQWAKLYLVKEIAQEVWGA
ncbi:MAG: 5-methyltetrahydropteroyltriglutamate--homocysteine S-methyltransferase [Bacteroidales bacterium]|nr:5-methyltetrahydropteroyltriglutamate--homocysteine S-methyltransferase [Bacteroidales bacterium]